MMAEFAQMGMPDGKTPLTINNKIKIIQLFCGYGSQALALKYLGADYECWTCSEWAIPSIKAYYDMHFGNNQIDYSEGMSQEDLVNFFTEHAISSDYNTPLTTQQLRKRKDLRDLYNMGMASKNKFSICGMTGKDLNIVDTDKFTYVLTWSFPCQDLSISGKMAGMSKDSGTRSSLAFEVIRLLQECDKKPQILLMENVPQVCNEANLKAFSEILSELQRLGYQNKWQILNGTEYGIPQNRNRCFMVSWLDEQSNYDFPVPIGNDLRLKDFLEKNVDERYYLSLSDTEKFIANNPSQIDNAERESKTVRAGGHRSIDRHSWDIVVEPINRCVQIGTLAGGRWDKQLERSRRVYGADGVSPTLTTCVGGGQAVKVGEITTIEEMTKQDSSYNPYIAVRARQYTGRECFRLMGVKDADFARIEPNQSRSRLYHLAGDSIITSCMMAIFGEMIGCDWREKVEELQKDLQNQCF